MDSSSVFKSLSFAAFASIIAAGLTHPIDTLKVHVQVVGNRATSAIATLRQLIRSGNTADLLLGLNPALLRAATYGSFRYAIYTPIKDMLATEEYTNTIYVKILSGCISGCISSALFSPTDLIKVRMQTGWANEGFRTIWQSFRTIIRKEGFLSLWTGVGPTCARATVLAAAELSTYDHVKHDLLAMGLMADDIGLHFVASLAAGFVASAASNPFDFAKSRIMNQHKDKNGVGLLYRNTLDCMVKSAKQDGVLVLWSGFYATFARIGPNIIITFIIMEQLKKLFDKPAKI